MSMTDTQTATPLPVVIDPAQLRQCLGSFVTGVTVITAIDDQGVHFGMTANSFNSVSLDPPLIVWSLRMNASAFPVFSQAKRFVVNILSEDQVDVSNRFAKSGADRFEGVATAPGLGGLPLIDGCAAYLECSTEATYPGGDHLLFLGRVERLRGSARKPLAFGAGRYMVVHPYDNTLKGEVGSGNIATQRAVHLARPCLEDLTRETDKTVGLGVWGNMGPTLIWWIEASKPLDVRLRAGMVIPLLGSSTGKVFAAFSDPLLTNRYLDAEIAAQQHLSDSPFKTREAVDAHLAQVRKDRLASIEDAVIIDVNDLGVNAFSAPVFDASGSIVLALTMMGDASFNRQDPAVAHLREAAERLSARLGYKA